MANNIMNNRMFVGPPGSGKTYRAKYEVIKTIWNSMDENEKNRKDIRFFDPGNFCEDAFNYVEKNSDSLIRLVSLHEGMTVEDFTEGISIETNEGINNFVCTEKIVLQLINKIQQTQKPGFLILDDIHRVNLTGVLGELLFAFAHRNEKITLASGTIIKVPENLYVYLTMNTLRPEFSFDASILSAFQMIHMETGIEYLERAIEEEYYKSAYYGINSNILDSLVQIQGDINRLTKEIKEDNASFSRESDFEKLFNLAISRCFDKEISQYLLNVGFPIIWEDRNDIPRKYVKKYNIYARTFFSLLNDAYEMFSKYVSSQTLEMLELFKRKVKEEYEYYNDFLEYISPEYIMEKNKYMIGYTYFLPGHGFSMWNAYELLANKIRAQVIPLLNQYLNDGIIVGCKIPSNERTSTKYTRDYSEVSNEKIEIRINNAYRDIFLESFNEKKSADDFRQQGGQRYNSNYGVLFELIHDIITAPLINEWEIMDILLYDKEIYFKLDKSKSWGSCLLCDSELASKVRLDSSDATAGNDNGVYRADLHAFFYRGRKYFLVSKIKTENHERYQLVERCRQKKSVKRELSLYGMVKVLVYNYLNRFLTNLRLFRAEQTDKEIIKDLDVEISLVIKDLNAVDQLSLHGSNNNELRWNLLKDVREIDTWNKMVNKEIKGVYRIMDDRYQSIMDSTGIHQMILQGPPGTSKTYGVKEFLALQANLIKEQGEKWNQEELNARQLHTQNDSYVLPTENLPENNMIYWDIIQFHPSYTYEDFVRGISVSASNNAFINIDGEIKNGEEVLYSINMKQPSSIMYKTVNRTLGKMAKIAREYYDAVNPENSPKFYLIIDEINRANLSTVFGELIYALEYRDSEVATPYTVDNDSKLLIPDNLYIVGTMNTADKSIASIDYAIRRRFLFFPVLPDIKVVYETVKDEWSTSVELQLFYIIEKIFELYMNSDDYHRNDVQIGHTYFLRKAEERIAKEQMKNRFLFQVIPVLREYYNDGILMDDVYGKDPTEYESACIQDVRKMIEVSDMDKLERMYDELLSKLDNEQIKTGIKAALLEKNVLPE